jgi:hypothetical protein
MNASRDEERHSKAIELVRAAYDVADSMRKVNLGALNDSRPPTLRYHAQYELVREFVAQANAMLDFAGKLGLIDADENREISRSVAPELWQWLDDEDKRLSTET